jgi:hypothetical protein
VKPSIRIARPFDSLARTCPTPRTDLPDVLLFRSIHAPGEGCPSFYRTERIGGKR